MRGAALQQAVGEPAGRRAGVERVATGDVDRRTASSAASSLSPPRPTNRGGGPATHDGVAGATRRAGLSATAPLTSTRSLVDQLAGLGSRLTTRPRRTSSASSRRRRDHVDRRASVAGAAIFFAAASCRAEPSSPQPSWPASLLRRQPSSPALAWPVVFWPPSRLRGRAVFAGAFFAAGVFAGRACGSPSSRSTSLPRRFVPQPLGGGRRRPHARCGRRSDAGCTSGSRALELVLDLVDAIGEPGQLLARSRACTSRPICAVVSRPRSMSVLHGRSASLRRTSPALTKLVRRASSACLRCISVNCSPGVEELLDRVVGHGCRCTPAIASQRRRAAMTSAHRGEVGPIESPGRERRRPARVTPGAHQREPATERTGEHARRCSGRSPTITSGRGGRRSPPIEVVRPPRGHRLVRLAGDLGLDPRGRRDRGEDRSATGDRTAWRRVRRVVVGADQPGAAEHGRRCQSQPVVVELRGGTRPPRRRAGIAAGVVVAGHAIAPRATHRLDHPRPAAHEHPLAGCDAARAAAIAEVTTSPVGGDADRAASAASCSAIVTRRVVGDEQTRCPAARSRPIASTEPGIGWPGEPHDAVEVAAAPRSAATFHARGDAYPRGVVRCVTGRVPTCAGAPLRTVLAPCATAPPTSTTSSRRPTTCCPPPTSTRSAARDHAQHRAHRRARVDGADRYDRPRRPLRAVDRRRHARRRRHADVHAVPHALHRRQPAPTRRRSA